MTISMTGKRGLIMGVANDRSIAWGIAKAMHAAGAELAFSISVGATHWDQRRGDTAPLPGPTPEFFFAPGQRAKRVEDWGAAELDARIDRAYRRLVDHSAGWLRVEHRHGPDGIEATYAALLDGTADPAAGFICHPTFDEAP